MHVAASTGRVVAGRYLLQHPIGRGAMGTVWRARDSVLDRDVAVKEVRVRGAATSEETQVLYERTLREARTAARLNHPAVVTVFDVIDADGSPWIVMELIEARSLEQVLATGGPLLPYQAADLGTRVLEALHCAHAAGILHRDVKPSNVLLGAGGRAVLTDFGIATLDGDASLTQTGMVMGTPGFTAPERVRGEPASPSSDLWSLGATLFAAVEGHGPFDDRGSPLAILAAIAHEEPPRPRSAGPLRPVIEALLRRDPWARPDATAAGEMLAAAATDDRAADDGLAGDRLGDSGPVDSGLAGDDLADDRRNDAGPGEPGVFGPPAGFGQGSGFGQPAGWSEPGRPGPPGDFGQAWAAGPPAGDAGHPWADEWAEAGTGPLPVAGPSDPADLHLVVSSDEEEPGWAQHAWAGDTPYPYAADQYPAEAIGAEPFAAEPFAAEPFAAEPFAAEPFAAEPFAAEPFAAEPFAAEGFAGGLVAGYRRDAPPPEPRRRGMLAELGGLRPDRRGVLLACLAGLAVLGVGLLAGLAWSHGAGRYHSYSVPGHTAGAAAGFTTSVPADWHRAQRGPTTVFTSPSGRTTLHVTPTSLGARGALGTAQLLEAQAVQQRTFPGYRRIALHPFRFSGGTGVLWQYTWQPPSGGRAEALEALFQLATPSGRQGYLVQETAPATTWLLSRPVFNEALRTFRTDT
jgi:tRNA A-37 threonylcarbamoyl transferase component Bud32